MAIAINSALGTAVFDQCAIDLEANGYALLPLPNLHQHQLQSERQTKTTSSIISQAFGTARRALDDADDARPLIDPTSDSGGWTGYHNAAVVNGRYNQYREGFVFSNGEMFDVKLNNNNEDSFEHEMKDLFNVMHDDVACEVLRAIERRLELPHLYFHKDVGPTQSSSQWHMKRYVVDYSNSQQDEDKTSTGGEGRLDENEAEADIFLPVHTDPSLISVVILDRPGKNEGGMGLEVFHPSPKTEINNPKDDGTIKQSTTSGGGGSGGGTWKEISYHGHDVAIIFVGSVLSYLTGGQILAAAKHRVVDWNHNADDTTAINDNDSSINFMKARMVATLFVRPHADALMKALPSPYLQQLTVSSKKKDPPTFRVWNARVAKNYMKRKKKKGKK